MSCSSLVDSSTEVSFHTERRRIVRKETLHEETPSIRYSTTLAGKHPRSLTRLLSLSLSPYESSFFSLESSQCTLGTQTHGNDAVNTQRLDCRSLLLLLLSICYSTLFFMRITRLSPRPTASSRFIALFLYFFLLLLPVVRSSSFAQRIERGCKWKSPMLLCRSPFALTCKNNSSNRSTCQRWMRDDPISFFDERNRQ